MNKQNVNERELSALTQEELHDLIDDALKPYQPLLWGVCGMDGIPLPLEEKYEYALTLAVPFPYMVTIDEFTEPYFRGVMLSTFPRLQQALQAVKEVFHQNGLPCIIAPEIHGEEFEKKMADIISYKDCARRSGLGWIGKNCLLVTKEFGPRVCLNALLCNGPLKPGTPQEESLCGDCHQCATHCAYHVLRNKTWHPGIKREEMLDYVRCSTERLKTYGLIGRKIGCGKCIAACPYGTEASPAI